MIRVYRLPNSIEIIGHAEYAKRGKDIVCAAVSTLIQTLAQSIQELTDDEIDYTEQPGNTKIEFGHLSEPSKVLIDAFFIGVSGVAEAYPDYVKLTER